MNNGYNPLKNLFSIPRNPFAAPAPTFPSQPYDPYAESNRLTQALPTSYQIKAGDSFASIGSQFNLDEKQLQDRNKMIVPPPKGSWITVRPPGPGATGGMKPARPQTAQQLINQGVPASLAAQIAGQGTGTPGISPALASGTGANSFTSGANVNLGELTFSVQNQIANGVAPQSVPGAILNSLGATPQSMAANGYVLNPANNTWQLGGAGGPGADKPPDPFSEVKSVFYSRSRGRVTPEVAMLLDRKRRKRQEEGVVTPMLATNAGGTPTNTLDVRVGSG